ncbi:MAG: hypothetical protein AAB242_06200 [Nitrospirota bacterium]
MAEGRTEHDGIDHQQGPFDSQVLHSADPHRFISVLRDPITQLKRALFTWLNERDT